MRISARALTRTLAAMVGCAGVLLLAGSPADAHPLGNFTRNVYAGITVSPDRIRIDHVIDLAEIPTFQERQVIDADHDATVDPAETTAYQDRACAQAAANVHVTTDRRLALQVDAARLSFPPGASGLPTLRLECSLSTTLDRATSATVDDLNAAGRLGWHEITAIGDAVRLADSQIPSTSISHRLTRYPVDRLASPLAQQSATLSWTAGPPTDNGAGAAGHRALTPADSAGTQVSERTLAATPAGTSLAAVDAATRAFTGLVGRQQLTLPFALLACLLAVGLGGLHALAPGHGKTIMAGYLVGAGGRIRDAVTIGLSVTITHTAGVAMLAVLLVASARFAPETVYPWMTIASGLLAVIVGATLLRMAVNRYRHARGPAEWRAAIHPPVQVATTVPPGRPHRPGDAPAESHVHPDAAGPGDDHGHDDGHTHRHDHRHGHDHGHVHQHPHRSPADGVALRGLISLGFAGGLVPSPSALVVLLAGFSLHRAWFGLLLVVAYGVGMALALTGIGLLLVRASSLVERLGRTRPTATRLAPVLAMTPVLAALVVVIAGGYLVTRGLAAVGV